MKRHEYMIEDPREHTWSADKETEYVGDWGDAATIRRLGYLDASGWKFYCFTPDGQACVFRKRVTP